MLAREAEKSSFAIDPAASRYLARTPELPKMNEVTKGALARKLAKILGEVGKVEKTGHNSFHNYDYVTENDLVYAVRSKLAEAGVFVFTSVEAQHAEIIKSCEGDKAKSSLLTTVTTKHTFVDGDSGEEFSVLSQGQGSDNGDKGGYKAITGAMKYFLYKCFMIPTGDDPEGDSKTDERAFAGAASSSSVKSSAPSGGRSHAEDNKKDPEVPRDIPASVKDKFRNNKWTAHQIHLGKQKGTPLGKLETASLTWWITDWAPKPFNGKIDPKDVDLRAALDVADEEWK